jgi:hypothetical protein
MKLSENFKKKIQELAGILNEIDAASYKQKFDSQTFPAIQKFFRGMGYKVAVSKNLNDANTNLAKFAIASNPKAKNVIMFYNGNPIGGFNILVNPVFAGDIQKFVAGSKLVGPKDGEIKDFQLAYQVTDPQSKQVQKRNDKFKAYILKPNLAAVAAPAAAPAAGQPTAAAAQGQALFKEEKNSDIYFETLSQALDKILEKATKNGYEIEDQEREFFLFGIGGIGYGETKKGSFNLLKDGKSTKKKLQVQIYRMDSGRYELNQYIA